MPVVPQVKAKLDDLSASELRQVRRYEKHEDRKTLPDELERRL